MHTTTKRETNEKVIMVDAKGLAALLSCGLATARKIGEDSHAKVTYGRRVLYLVSKVERYLEMLAE